MGFDLYVRCNVVFYVFTDGTPLIDGIVAALPGRPPEGYQEPRARPRRRCAAFLTRKGRARSATRATTTNQGKVAPPPPVSWVPIQSIVRPAASGGWSSPGWAAGSLRIRFCRMSRR
jgi:hypothetical protein